jgi:predicted metal-dependent enzyme (double-stranded beta helix superfamily)
MQSAVFVLLCLFSVCASGASHAGAAAEERIYRDLVPEVLLDNERVRVEKFLILPGQTTGAHAQGVGRLLVIIKGGLLASNSSHRVTVWKDGNVFWQSVGPSDPGTTNIGTAPVEVIWVTPKPVITATATTPPLVALDSEARHIHYPNIPGEDLFENEQIIVQRFVMQPGQWEGVHAHTPNSLYIFVKGGQWISRTYRNPKQASGDSPDGSVGWMEPVDIKEGHESGNVGKAPSEVIWVLFKQ